MSHSVLGQRPPRRDRIATSARQGGSRGRPDWPRLGGSDPLIWQCAEKNSSDLEEAWPCDVGAAILCFETEPRTARGPESSTQPPILCPEQIPADMFRSREVMAIPTEAHARYRYTDGKGCFSLFSEAERRLKLVCPERPWTWTAKGEGKYRVELRRESAV